MRPTCIAPRNGSARVCAMNITALLVGGAGEGG